MQEIFSSGENFFTVLVFYFYLVNTPVSGNSNWYNTDKIKFYYISITLDDKLVTQN